ncbi:MAG: hypothetical protein JXA33_09800 [Anaerolineae bacterium]|nr:hypothetical protein [Anaerolineae bacterium]
MPWPTALIRLQHIDFELTEIAQRLAAIEAILKDRSEIQRATQALQTYSTIAETARKQQQTLEFELNRIETKRRQTEQRLYSGKVTNPRELEDLQAESKSLLNRKSQLEDELLEAMIEREEADADQTTAQSQLKNTQTQQETQYKTLTTESEQILNRQRELQEERQILLPHIPANILETYHYLYSRMGGLPVAQLRGEVCSICGMNVNKPTQIKVRKGEEAYCDGCRRLIVT